MGIRGETVRVLSPVEGPPDAMGAASTSWDPVEVADVLVCPRDPGAAADLGAERPNGTTAGLTLHFPKSFSARLRGCRVEARGELWDVVGDPFPLTAENCPGKWWYPVDVEVTNG
jgi:hypothetical protein